MTKQFAYDHLFASNVPESQAGGPVHRAKYDFAIAYPDPSTVPIKKLAQALDEGLIEEGSELAVYPDKQGYEPLREFVSNKLAVDRNIHVSADQIILGDGSSQPIHALVETLVDPNDVVLTENYVYSGTLATLHRFKADIRGVLCDDEGMLPDELENTIQHIISEQKRPKMIYTIPVFQNPQGWTMSLERRKELLRIAGHYGVPILEDDCYVDLRYDGDPVTSIHSLDSSGLVMYVGSFSKTIAPGMRMGYLTAPEEVMGKVRSIKSGGGVNQFAALAIHRLAVKHLDQMIEERNHVLKTKRDSMLAALGENFGSQASWSHPDGGLYIWLKMPSNVDLSSALQPALEADVGYHPGTNFSPKGTTGKNYARLCFGYNTSDEIHEGIGRLAEVFENIGYLE